MLKTSQSLEFVPYSSWALPLTAFALLCSGTCTMTLVSLMNRTETARCPGCDLGLFKAPFTQQLANGVGQMSCLLVYYLDHWLTKLWHRDRRLLDYDRHDSIGELPEPSPYVWVFPAFLDFAASMLLLYALVLDTASNVQILRTFSVILCAVLSVSYLHRDLRVFHWLGIAVMTLGLLLTGWDSIYSSTAQTHTPSSANRWLGVILTIISTSLTVFQLVFEERIISNWKCNPFKSVGWIGIWGTVLALIASLSAHVADYERMDLIWWQIAREPRLQAGIICFSLATSIFTGCGLAVTKMGAALLTTTITALRQVPIWGIELILRWTIFGWVGFFGMVLTCLGFLLYNHLVPTGCCPGYERVVMKEVRIRCTCHDDDNDEDDEDDEDGIDDDAALEETATTSSTVKTEALWKTAVITTRATPPQHSDSKSAWIYVRRSESFISAV